MDFQIVNFVPLSAEPEGEINYLKTYKIYITIPSWVNTTYPEGAPGSMKSGHDIWHSCGHRKGTFPEKRCGATAEYSDHHLFQKM